MTDIPTPRRAIQAKAPPRHSPNPAHKGARISAPHDFSRLARHSLQPHVEDVDFPETAPLPERESE